MIRRRYITLLLLCISLLMLMVPVMPHHHHTGEAICVLNDLRCGGNLSHPASGHSHCCHNKGCITTHFFQRIPTIRQGLQSLEKQILTAGFARFFTEPVPILVCSYSTQLPLYAESLYGTCVVQATGLRAPPVRLF